MAVVYLATETMLARKVAIVLIVVWLVIAVPIGRRYDRLAAATRL